MKPTLCIPQTLCYAFTGQHFGKSGSKYIQTLGLIVSLMGVPSRGLLFQSTFTAFVCWPSCKCSTSSSFLPGFVYVLLLQLNFFPFGFMGRPDNNCWGSTTICSWRVKIDFGSWTDYQQLGCVLPPKSTGNLLNFFYLDKQNADC